MLRRRRRADPLRTASAAGGAGRALLRRVLGGMLVQDADAEVDERGDGGRDRARAERAAWGDLLFAWRVAKHVTSNAIVLAKELATIGIGAGQMSRVDAVRIAVEKAARARPRSDGAVLASDAFFPFADGPQIALEAGVAAVIQPGGSKRDDEVVAAVETAGAAMAFTGRATSGTRGCPLRFAQWRASTRPSSTSSARRRSSASSRSTRGGRADPCSPSSSDLNPGGS